MRIPRIYTPQTLIPQQTIQLEEQASAHLMRVLRLKEGHSIVLFDGSGYAFQAEIATLSKKTLAARIIEPLPQQPTSPLHSEIALAVSKGDKMDWIIQKATELGVNTISPVISTRTDIRLDEQRWQKKHASWQQIMISACEQSGRDHLVTIHPVQALIHWLQNCQASSKLICHLEQSTRFAEVATNQDVAMCFGSEGGFTDEEVKLAQTHGFIPVSMGPRVLRAETAPLAALAIAQAQWGDF